MKEQHKEPVAYAVCALYVIGIAAYLYFSQS